MRRVGVVAAVLAAVAVSHSASAAEPTFVNGLAQNVFSANTADWIRGEGWVQSTYDSDHDGRPDRIHFDITRPRETAEGLKVPAIIEASPYFANLGPNSNWSVDHEIGAPPPPRAFQPNFTTRNTSPKIATTFEAAWLPRGFAVMHVDSPGTGNSEGCPTDGAPNENDAMKAVIDWLNGRAPAYTTRTGDTPIVADWATGKAGMMGTSYNGSLPIAAAATGVAGLEAIVPISPVTDYYDYYRANGVVRGPGGWQGEDADVLIDVVYTRQDETYPRMICRSLIEQVGVLQDRVTGDRNAFWDERNLNALVPNMRAAVLLAHGNNDNNVMTKHAGAFYEALKAHDVPRQFFFHQGGHGGAPPDVMLNRWFTRYLYGVQNGVESLPKSWVVRSETGACPPRESAVTTQAVNTSTLTVADSSQLPLGFTLTIPQTNTNGSITNTTRVIADVAGNTLTLASPVATATGQRVVVGALVSLACGNANPSPYAEWPDPGARQVVQKLVAGSPGRGGLTFAGGSGGTETLTDDARIPATTSMNAASSGVRLVYQTGVLAQPLRISGTPWLNLRIAFSKPKANLTGVLVSYPGTTGNGTILARGWMDPENRSSFYRSDPVTPGEFYDVRFDLQPKDIVVPAGRRLAFMILSSDFEHTLRPAPGTQLTVDTANSSVSLPIVGGAPALAAATGEPYAEAAAEQSVGASVPATLSLALGAPVSFGAFVPGVAQDYTASTTATVVSSAGDAALTVSDPSPQSPGHLVNGAFALPQPLRGLGTVKVYAGPVSNDAVTVEFTQPIAATDPLRTGVYSKTLTFTLSTTNP